MPAGSGEVIYQATPGFAEAPAATTVNDDLYSAPVKPARPGGDAATSSTESSQSKKPTGSAGDFIKANVFKKTDRAAAEALLVSHSGGPSVGLFLLRHKNKTSTVLAMVTDTAPEFVHHVLEETAVG